MSMATLLRYVYISSAAVVGFIITCALLHMIPMNRLRLYAEERSEKLVILDSVEGRATVAAFGSSHVHNGFDPRAYMRIFPSQMVVNGAVTGGSQTEQRVLASEFIDRTYEKHARIHTIILELTAGTNFTADHLVHPRAINIYDRSTIAFAFACSNGDITRSQAIGRKTFALSAGLLHYCNFGMLSNYLFRPALKQELVDSQMKNGRLGLRTVKPPTAFTANFLKKYSDKSRKFVYEKGSYQSGAKKLVDELSARIHRWAPNEALPKFVYIVMPMLSQSSSVITYPSSIATSVGPVPIINLARPDRYPELFTSTLWDDEAHVNEKGAGLLTTIFAKELLKSL